jgi:uncharacterized membrane protein
MTATRFDELLRTTAARGTSRRGLLKGMVGAALAGSVAVITTSSGEAAKPRQQRCEDRQRDVCKERYAKGELQAACGTMTQGECIEACYQERITYFCS